MILLAIIQLNPLDIQLHRMRSQTSVLRYCMEIYKCDEIGIVARELWKKKFDTNRNNQTAEKTN